VFQVDFARGVNIADEVVSGVNVFGACMTYVVLDVFQSCLGVGFDDCRTNNGTRNGGQKVTKEFGLFGFFGCFGESDVFGFHGGECNSGLFVGLPGYRSIGEEEDVTRGGFAVIGISCKACIGIIKR
jgi:hypothetical protein